VKHWSAARVAGTAGAELVREHPDGRAGDGPTRVVIDSRSIQPGDLFVGIPGERVDGGSFAAGALAAGAWGVLVTPDWAADALSSAGGAVIVSPTPVPALGALARAWRRDLASHVIAITGSVGKTSTKDLCAALIAPHRAVASNPKNWNTEIGLPLAVLAAPLGTEVMVLEMGMRGFGQIAELAAICEPDVGVITNIGPVHLEQVGSLEGVARAKAELLEALYDGATAVVPSDEPLLEPWLRDSLSVVTFGPGGDVSYEGSSLRGGAVPDSVPSSHVINARGTRVELTLPFDQAHNLLNTLAAVAAAQAVGVTPGGVLDVRFSGLRGERVLLGMGAPVINDCYNANPLSMRAALDDLASHETAGRRIAVLGDMLELGPGEDEHHRDIGAYAATAGVDVLVSVGVRAAHMLDRYDGEGYAVADAGEAAALTGELLGAGDVLLVKGSRGVGLEVVAEALAAAADSEDPADG
jgi:UDP-N-acetylmuramoyl-tripeptide--D-alanyl-D-alanine ligase